MRLHDHFSPASGYTELVTPQTHPVQHIHFGMLRLEDGAQYGAPADDFEVGLVILSGTCSIRVNGQVFEGLGGRASVYDGRATGVYVPRDADFEVQASAGDVEIAVCRCLTEARHPPQVIRPSDVVAREVGGPGFKRYVHDILGTQMQAGKPIVGETFTIAGNWSSYPPHKHDVEDLPEEVRQEELYLYKIRPAQGFGIQYLYSPPGSPRGALEQALPVRDDDLTIMPFGYHPVAAPPGYDVCYLWFLAGDTRLMRPHDDPVHAWVKTTSADERQYPS